MKVTPKMNMTIPSSSIAQNKVFADLRLAEASYQLPPNKRFFLHFDMGVPQISMVDTCWMPQISQMSHEKTRPYFPLYWLLNRDPYM